MNNYLHALLKTMRPKQWTKNSVLFAGLVFSLHLFDPLALLKVTAAFILFCMVSGTVYIINDVIDYEKDRNHPEKRHRPIAAGLIPRPAAAAAAAAIITGALLLAFLLQPRFGIICLVYFTMNLGYSLYLKNLVIIDVLIIAIGFVLRAVAGAMVIDVVISEWLLICTLLLALFLALCKRRHELIQMEYAARAERRECAETGPKVKTRQVLAEYSAELLDQMIAVVTASALMAYSLYTISGSVQTKFHTTNLQFTIPFVLFGIFRYLYLVHKKQLGGSPELILLKDPPIIIDVLLWLGVVFLVLYLG
ncbi:decaprenyl-phosphate phosphoribosyltransferase [bacterium]|nr:decaprenyl-phosphate phosphoribosyltransferase [candidate division CSSED10-310 bacterium]